MNTVTATLFLFAVVIGCAQAKPECGTVESDYTACVGKSRANAMFRQCCQQFAPDGCQELCQYETEEVTARNLDNRKCCEHLNMADPKLGVGRRCLRFCDPAGEGINVISRDDVTCLFNWNVLMYCHHSGIPQE